MVFLRVVAAGCQNPLALSARDALIAGVPAILEARPEVIVVRRAEEVSR